MILTQYRPHSLNEHIGSGRPWDLDRNLSGGVTIYPPYRGRLVTDWYKGTADAIFQNLSFVERGRPDLVLVLSGDHIYKMNYGALIEHHIQHQAELTIATRNVSREEATRMGVLAANSDLLVTAFVEKPKDPPGTLASMGIYVFNRRRARAGAPRGQPASRLLARLREGRDPEDGRARGPPSTPIPSTGTGWTSERSSPTGRRRWTCSTSRRRSI